MTAPDGNQYMPIGGDYNLAINVHSEHKEAGVLPIEENSATEGKASYFSDINNESELGVGSTDIEKQRIIDAAIGNTDESFEDIMADFNSRWVDAKAVVSEN